MNRNAFKVPLLNKDGKINTEMLPNYDENDKLRADYANYANYLVTNNTKINVGSSSKPIYFNGGKPVASSTSLGNSQQPIYMQSGEFKTCDNIPFYALIERTALDATDDTDLAYINTYFFWHHFGDTTFFNEWKGNWSSLTKWNGEGTENPLSRIIYNGFVLGQSFSLSVRIDFVSGATDDRVIWIKSGWIKSVLKEATQSSRIYDLYYDAPIATPKVEQAQKKTPTTFTFVGEVNSEDQVYIGFDGGDCVYGVNILITGQVKYRS